MYKTPLHYDLVWRASKHEYMRAAHQPDGSILFAETTSRLHGYISAEKASKTLYFTRVEFKRWVEHLYRRGNHIANGASYQFLKDTTGE